MAAAPFKATLVFQDQAGARISYYCTVSDVNAAYYVFPDGNGFLTLPSNRGIMTLVDVILSAAGTDTSTASLYVNGKITGDVLVNSANVYSVLARQFQSAPIRIAPGALIRLAQAT